MDLQQAYELDDDERKNYSFESPYPQRHFSLPENIIYYFTKNPTNVTAFIKILQTCKYFYSKSQILPVKTIEQHSSNQLSVLLLTKSGVKEINIDFEMLSRKLWLHSIVSISYSSNVNLASALIKNVYQCCLQELNLKLQILTFEELQILFSGKQLEEVSFIENMVVNDDDGKFVEFEKVFEVIKCASLNITFADEGHGVGGGTAEKIAQIMDNEVLPLSVCLGNIPHTFDFFLFLKNNIIQRRKHTFNLHYYGSVPDSLKEQFRKFAEEIGQIRSIYACSVPLFYFPDIDMNSYMILLNMRRGDVPGVY